MQITEFDTIGDEFIDTVNTQVWCSVATVNTKGRPRSRVLHPIWERSETDVTGWIATGRHTLKTKHLANNPYISLCYMIQPLTPLYVDCHAEWVDDMEEKRRIWEWFGSTPPPMGYDLAQFFGTLDNPNYGLLKLTPWRVELANLLGDSRVWKAD